MAASTPWLARRVFPVLATAGLIAIGMASSVWWGPGLLGKSTWLLPHDLWGTLVAAQRLLHLDLGGLYTRPTALITFPGAAVILAPAAAVIDAAGLPLAMPGAHNPHPGVWLVAGPYQIAISAIVLFAADAIAGHLGLGWRRRAFLAAAEAAGLWNVSVEWGHPEDAVAVGLLLFAILAMAQQRAGRCAWLTGAAVAVQPLVLLALPFCVVTLPPRRMAGFLARAAAPAAMLLAAAALANWQATVTAVTSQPNWPAVDQPTPWTWLAPVAGSGAVAAGPARILAIVVATGCALAVGRRWRTAPGAPGWSPAELGNLLWWAALALAVRCLLEPVMVAYYLWPALAVALIAAARSWPRLITTSVIALADSFASLGPWRGVWVWWVPMIAGLCLTLAAARARLPARAAQVAVTGPAAQPARADR